MHCLIALDCVLRKGAQSNWPGKQASGVVYGAHDANRHFSDSICWRSGVHVNISVCCLTPENGLHGDRMALATSGRQRGV